MLRAHWNSWSQEGEHSALNKESFFPSDVFTAFLLFSCLLAEEKKKVRISPFPYLEYIAMACSLLFNIYVCIGRTCRGFVLLSGLPKERAHLCNKLFQSWSPLLNYPLTIPARCRKPQRCFLGGTDVSCNAGKAWGAQVLQRGGPCTSSWWIASHKPGQIPVGISAVKSPVSKWHMAKTLGEGDGGGCSQSTLISCSLMDLPPRVGLKCWAPLLYHIAVGETVTSTWAAEQVFHRAGFLGGTFLLFVSSGLAPAEGEGGAPPQWSYLIRCAPNPSGLALP